MEFLILRAIAITCVLTIATACTKPIHKVESTTYGYGPQAGTTVEQIKPKIEGVAKKLGWRLSDVQTGSFTAKREWGGGKHNIVVDVVYNTSEFSINYKNSWQMGYDGDSIHHTYNEMVERLEEDIKESVSKI